MTNAARKNNLLRTADRAGFLPHFSPSLQTAHAETLVIHKTILSPLAPIRIRSGRYGSFQHSLELLFSYLCAKDATLIASAHEHKLLPRNSTFVTCQDASKSISIAEMTGFDQWDNFSMGLRVPCFDEGTTWPIFETKKCVEPRHSQNRCTISSNTFFVQLSSSIHSNCCTSQDTAFDAQRFAICHLDTVSKDKAKQNRFYSTGVTGNTPGALILKIMVFQASAIANMIRTRKCYYHKLPCPGKEDFSEEKE